jgi:hypothetical protein
MVHGEIRFAMDYGPSTMDLLELRCPMGEILLDLGYQVLMFIAGFEIGAVTKCEFGFRLI